MSYASLLSTVSFLFQYLVFLLSFFYLLFSLSPFAPNFQRHFIKILFASIYDTCLESCKCYVVDILPVFSLIIWGIWTPRTGDS